MFYVGLDSPNHAEHFARAFISVNAVRGRKKPVPSKDWILDSGAFREIEQYGCYRHEPAEYAAEVNRLAAINPGLKIAVSQDYMCEEWILAKSGLTVADHQRLTVERYDALLPLINVYLMPVLQGYSLESYLDHVEQYGDRLRLGAYVGLGSVCKRNIDTRQVEAIVVAIKKRRPDLYLHGFGLKKTALFSALVRDNLHSADSMAWSFHARKNGRNQHDWREALAFVQAISRQNVQLGWGF